MSPSWIEKNIHPRHHRDVPTDGTGHWETTVDPKNVPKGIYEQQFGYPADIDKVWAAREEHQKCPS